MLEHNYYQDPSIPRPSAREIWKDIPVVHRIGVIALGVALTVGTIYASALLEKAVEHRTQVVQEVRTP